MAKLPYRVLQVVTTMDRGGIETMIMNHYRTIDRNKIQFDFLVHRVCRGAYDDEIESLGGKIYRAFPIRPWNYHLYFKWLNNFFKEHHNYVAVHAHIQENSGFALKYAAKYGIRNRLSHSHSTLTTFDSKYIFRMYAKKYINKYATNRISCGKVAGDSLFSPKFKYLIFKNAINSPLFTYNKDIRLLVRQELNLTDDFIIGNIARFNPSKNHDFVIDVFLKILKQISNAKLIFVGDGPTRILCEERAKKEGISDKIIFLGNRNDVYKIVQAIDVILFPSLFEGIPVSIIEAQAAGLPCILSDTIDPESAITPNVEFYSLNAPIEEWVDAVISKRNLNRTDTTHYIKSAGYDVHENIKLLENIYLSNS